MARARDLWIVLRARDEASRVFRSFGASVATSTRGAATNMSRFERMAHETGATLQRLGLTAQLTGAAMIGAGAAGLSFIKSAIDVAAAYDTQVRRTLTQVDKVGVSLEDIAGIGRRVARDIAVPFETVQETLFFIFSSMQVNVTEAEELLRGFSKAAVAGSTDVESAARSTIAVMNALSIPVEDLTKVQDIQFQIVRKGIINYEELSAVIGRSLPATARAGQNFETLGAMISFMTTQGLSAAMASTSAARALESFAHPKTVERLEAMGVAVRGVDGEFRPLIDVMRDMNEKMKDMTQPQRVALMQELFKSSGGTIQARRFWDLAFSNFTDFEQHMGFMEDAAGSFDAAYGLMAGSVSAQSELLRNKWMLIKEAIGRALLPAFLQIVTLLQGALDWFDKLPQPVKNIIAQFLAWGSVALVVVGALIAVIGTLAFFIGGIISAGTALLVAIGIIAAIVLEIAGFAAAIILAWQNSERFRDILSTLIDTGKELWEIFVNFAKGVRDAFEEHLLPPLERLWLRIETRVLPVVQDLIDRFKDEFIPLAKEVADFIGGALSAAFEFVGGIITDQLIPALGDLQKWYYENEHAINVVIEVLKQVAMGMAVVVGIIIFGLVASIGLAINAFVFMTGAALQMWEWMKTIWNWFAHFGEHWSSLMNAIGLLWSNLWRGVVEGLIDARDAILMAAVEFALKMQQKWSDLMNWIGERWSSAWRGVLDFFRNIWNSIVSWASDRIALLRSLVSDGINSIKTRWNDGLNALKNKAKEIWDNIKGFFRDAIQNIKDFFSGAKSWLFNAGKNIIQGLIDGINNMLGPLAGVASNVVSAIGDMLPGSPVKKGPLRVLNRGYAGKQIVKMVADGMTQNREMLERAAASMAGAATIGGALTSLQPTVSAPPFGGFTPVGRSSSMAPPSEPKVVNQNITVNTNEIDPVKHSEELGFLLLNKGAR